MFAQQLTFFGIYLLCLALHAVAFKNAENSWADALANRQWMYLLYLVVAYLIVEYALRRKP